jgi:RNA polymerase sigma-70 factor (ECF subfamily)
MTIEEKERMFREVIANHRDRIYRLCCGYVKDRDERQDVYQEVLIHVWEGLERFDGRAQIGTWIYRIAVNTCFGFFRSEGRRLKVFEPGYGEAALGVAEETADPEVEHLYRCIGLLAPADRVIVTLYLEDLSTAEIAGVLGTSEGNVRVRLHRVRRKLKELIEEESHGS